mmetsp:Transcript_56/g.81  ORF Transcript_56/g.81 Transcript_56/m.81 type:complete len:325 (-) Transcript_56:194-1168(-)
MFSTQTNDYGPVAPGPSDHHFQSGSQGGAAGHNDSYPPGGFPQQGFQSQGQGFQSQGYQQPGGYPPVPGGMGMPKSLNVVSDWSVAFFMAACCIMLGAIIAGIDLFFSFELVDFLEMCYMFVFGGVLALMDTPCFKNMKTVSDHKLYFSKYVNLLTRVTGKGITFLFLGCSLFSNMWENLEGNGLEFLAFVLCSLPILVGIAALVIGFMKSQKLSRARQSLPQEEVNVSMIYDQYARTFPGPQGGLTQVEFNDLTVKTAGIKWEDADLKLIFNALVVNPQWRTSHNVNPGMPGGSMNNMGNMVELAKIPKQDLVAWVQGGMVWL